MIATKTLGNRSLSFWPHRRRSRRSLSDRPRRSRPLTIEPLEDRTLLSVDFGFAIGIGSAAEDVGLGITTDSSENVYVTGRFQGTADFDPGAGIFNLSASGGNHAMFVAKYSPTGQLAWARAMTGSGLIADGRGITVDASGSVLIAGGFAGTIDFDPGPGTFNLSSTGTSSAYILKLSASGDFVWAGAIVGGTAGGGAALAVDSLNNIYMAGAFAGTADFDPGPGTFQLTAPILPGPPQTGAFVLKLSSGGNFVWAKAFSGTGDSNRAFGIALDTTGNVYATGDFNGTTDFDPGAGTFNLTSIGPGDAWVAKLDNNGNFLWARALGGPAGVGALGVGLDAAGNAYVSGGFSGTADFDPGPGTFNLTSAGSRDVFVSKLDANGNSVWARAMGGPGDDFATFGIALDSAANVYTTGQINLSGPAGVTADFDPGPGVFNLTSAGQADIFVSKLDASGNFVWARAMGGTGDDRGHALALGAAGNVYTTGMFTGTADFDPGPATFNLTAAGGFDIFVSKLVPSVSGNTPVGASVVVQPVDTTTGTAPVTVTFATVTGTGTTSLTTSSSGPPPPVGFKLGTSATYYELTTTATVSGPVEVCINYSGISFKGKEENLKLRHFEDTDSDGIADTWVDRTILPVDTTNKIICASVTSLSLFAIFEPENQPPVASAGGPYTVVRGGSIQLDASSTTDAEQPTTTLTYEWDFDGNGQYDDATGISPVFSAAGIQTPHSRTIGLKVTDDGGLTNFATATIEIVVFAIQIDPCDSAQTALIVGGTVGDDTIAFAPAGNSGDIEAILNGVSLGIFHPTGRLIAYGQAGNDNIQVAGGISLSAWLYGDAGHDRLKGGAGHDVLFGGDGDDLLVGGGGRDLLIGGLGADRIVGNADDDILIAGFTTFDANETALCAILAEWTSERDYATRVANLQGTGSGPQLNGNVFLKTEGIKATVSDDGAYDVLTGSAGIDWFFANLDSGLVDKITDLSDAEFANDLDFILSA